jgi:hypothetical protein
MIHYKREGESLNIGLNITAGLNKGWMPWVTFCWAWYTPYTHKMKGWRIRIRTWRFAVFYTSSEWDVIESYLQSTDQRIITRELIEDIRLYAYLNQSVTLDALLDRYKLPQRYE